VVIHPLVDDRRTLPMEKRGEVLRAPPEFALVISYNPGYQSVLKELKHSTRQRFVAIEFVYPKADLEARIITRESAVPEDVAQKLVRLGHMTRNLKGSGLEEGASTRLLVHAGKLIVNGIDPRHACSSAIAKSLIDDPEMVRAVDDLTATLF
jgi:nitric oxide reductase NorQ protein